MKPWQRYRADRSPGLGQRRRPPRAALAVVDQAVSSATNFAASGYALLKLGVEDLGKFTVLYAMSGIIVSILRAGYVDPIVVIFLRSEIDRRMVYRAILSGSALATFIGLLASFLLHWATFAVALGGVLLVEANRVVFFATGREAMAVLLDATWLIGLVTFYFMIPVGPEWLYGSWVMAGCLAGLFGLFLAFSGHNRDPVAPPQSGGVRHLISPHLALEQAIEHSVLFVSILLLGLIAGTADLGEFGGIRTLFGPSGLMLLAVPLARLSYYVYEISLKVLLRDAALVAGSAGVYLVLVINLRGVLHSLGVPDLDLVAVVLFGCYMMVAAQFQVVRTFLKARSSNSELLKLRVWLTLATLFALGGAGAVGAVSARSVVAALLAGSLLVVPNWWLAVRRATSRSG